MCLIKWWAEANFPQQQQRVPLIRASGSAMKSAISVCVSLWRYTYLILPIGGSHCTWAYTAEKVTWYLIYNDEASDPSNCSSQKTHPIRRRGRSRVSRSLARLLTLTSSFIPSSSLLKRVQMKPLLWNNCSVWAFLLFFFLSPPLEQRANEETSAKKQRFLNIFTTSGVN